MARDVFRTDDAPNRSQAIRIGAGRTIRCSGEVLR